MAEVLVLRHAESAWNAEGRWQGQADPPLSPAGEDQCRRSRAAAGLFDLVITSDLRRAVQTGEILGDGAPMVVEPLLREYDVGEWSGHTRVEVERRWPAELHRFDTGRLVAPPGGETREAFDERVARGVAAAVTAIRARGAGRTLIVCHGGVVRCLLRLGGLAEHHIGQLCGYSGNVVDRRLVLTERVELGGHVPWRRPQQL